MSFFHFLGNALHGDSQPGGGLFGFLHGAANTVGKIGSDVGKVATLPINEAKFGVAQATHNPVAAENAVNAIHSGLTVARQTAQAFPRGVAQVAQSFTDPTVSPTAKPGLGQFIFGNEPVTSLQTTYSQARNTGHGVPFALGLAGISAAGDVPFGPGGLLKGTVMKDLAKASTASEAKKILIKNGIDEATATKIAPAIAKTKDPHIIDNLIQGNKPVPILPPAEKPAVAQSTPVGAVGKNISGGGQTWADMAKQRANTPEVSANQIEPQVSGAVDRLNKLGYRTGSSGFAGKDSALAKANGNVPTHTIDGHLGLTDAQISAVNKSGLGKVVKMDSFSPGYQAILVKGDNNLAKVGDNFNKIVDTIEGKPTPSIGVGKNVEEAPTILPPSTVAPNKHLETISKAPSTGPELQAGIAGLEQTHPIRSTEKLSNEAQQAVAKDYTGSLTKVLTSENPTDKEVAMGEHLIVQAQQEAKVATATGDQALHDSKMSEAVSVAESLDKTLRNSGRTVQAGSIIARLSPEGQLLRATRAIGKAREANPKNIVREQGTAKEIQGAVESTQLQKQDIARAVKDSTKKISADQQTLKLGGLEPKSGVALQAETTGQKLAKNVDRAVNPKVKKQADVLVQELTKKVKQEYLDPKITVKRSPTAVLREVFGRHPEAKEAYPLAQQILRDKYKDVPTMQKALDKFFSSELKLPAANSTVERAIGEQLAKNNTKITDIIHSSWNNQKQSVEDVTKALTKEGFDAQSAKTLAKEVTDRLNKKLAESKAKTLERMGRGVKERKQPTFLEKVSKLSNLGALNKEDYLHLARAKLNLPNLSTETASKISELSQKLQTLPEGHEKYATVREIQNTIISEIPPSKWQLAKEFLGLPRTVMASGDFSFGGRQGLVYATSHPIQFAKAWPKQFAYFKQAFKGNDSEAYDAMMADVRSNPNYHYLEKYGRLLDPTGHDIKFRNEQFVSSDMAEKIPALGRLVRGSNYAFTGLHNTLYANQFYGMLEHLQYAGIKGPMLEDQLKKTAEVIGTSLGRGGKSGGLLEKHGGFLSGALFAPRLIASRLNVMNPAYYIRLDGPARQEALRGLLGLSAFAGGILGLAELAGAKVSTDPRNADFGKIRVGDTRFDVLGGFTQYIRLGRQLQSGERINSTTGAQSEAGKGFAGSRLDIGFNFIQGKENPSVSIITDFLKGKDINGNSLYNAKGVTKEVIQRFTPLLLQDMADLQTHPDSAGPAAAIAGVFGTGIQTYGMQDLPLPQSQKDFVSKLKTQGASKEQITATQGFFQNLKVGAASRDTAFTKYKDAIINGDTNGAIQIANDYNEKLAQSLDKWDAQYGQYATEDLKATYRAQKITPTRAGIKSIMRDNQKSTKELQMVP